MTKIDKYSGLIEKVKNGEKDFDFRFSWINDKVISFKTKDYKEIRIKTKILKDYGYGVCNNETLREVIGHIIGGRYSIFDYIVYTDKC